MGKGNKTSQLVDPKSSLQSKQNTIVKLYYGATTDGKIKNKQDCGQPIEQDSISEIRITESIFGTLPKMIIKVFDNGEWANTFAFKAGTNIRLIIIPKNGNNDYESIPLLDCFFTLEGINTIIDAASCKYIYELSCIYSCESFINQVCSWPITEILAKLKSYKKTSKEVLEEVIGKTSLKFTYKCATEPSDNMLWLNKTLTFSKFAKHIIDHAWLGENDLPLMYINKNGQFVYDSLNRLVGQNVKTNYIFEQNYVKKKETAIANSKNNVTDKPYQDILFYNVPYKAFDDGCTIQMSQYNPYNRSEIDTNKQKPQKVQNEQENSYRQYEFNGNGTRLSSISNKSPKSINLLNKREYTGIYFKELHEFYNVAPLHHKNIRNAFFTNFCYITINTDEQFDSKDLDPQVNQKDKEIAMSYINLGDKIHVDASDSKYRNDLLSGDFIVSGITHLWAPNHNYTLLLQCVNDGTNGTPYMTLMNDLDKASSNKNKSR